MAARTIRVSSIPVVTIFVRHSTNCPRKGDGFHKNCRCSKHLRWSYGGEQFRRAARTRTWSVAEEAKREIEAKFRAAGPATLIETEGWCPEPRRFVTSLPHTNEVGLYSAPGIKPAVNRQPTQNSSHAKIRQTLARLCQRTRACRIELVRLWIQFPSVVYQ